MSFCLTFWPSYGKIILKFREKENFVDLIILLCYKLVSRKAIISGYHGRPSNTAIKEDMGSADKDHLPKDLLCSRKNRYFVFDYDYVYMYIFYRYTMILQWRSSALMDLSALSMKHCLKLSNIILIPYFTLRRS